jgi:hypothetical protein
MLEFLKNFKTTIDSAEKALLIYSELESLDTYAPGKWNKKEVIGHLIDSACNNYARFVTAQFKEDLIFPTYDQEKWVSLLAAHLQQWKFLVSFWKNYNLHILHLISQVPDEILNREIKYHNFDLICYKPILPEEPATLKYLIKDYYNHLKHHLSQILT